MNHEATIAWSNGKGYTYCTLEYRRVLDRKREIERRNGVLSFNEYSREDYEAWNALEDRLAVLHSEGHIGASVRY